MITKIKSFKKTNHIHNYGLSLASYHLYDFKSLFFPNSLKTPNLIAHYI